MPNVRPLYWPALIVAATFIAFAPVIGNEFVNWDDDKLIVNNPHFRGMSSEHLRWMFSTHLMGHYQPLTWLSYSVDHAIWGLNPRGYHLTNLLFHAAGAVVFCFVARQLLAAAGIATDRERTWSAGVAALLFAVHPLRVESVAWATERRDVLSGFFLLLAVLCYINATLNATGEHGRGRWLAAVVIYAASLLSKATGVGLPIILLVLDAYPLGRWARTAVRDRWRLLLEKTPFAILAIAAAGLAVWAESRAETVASLAAHSPTDRLLQAAFGLMYYLVKSLVPVHLSPLVPMPSNIDWTNWLFGGSVAACIAIGASLVFVRRRLPALVVAAVGYVVLLLPVLGLVQIGPQLAADRYSYLACLGPVLWLAAGAGLARSSTSIQPGVRLLIDVGACSVVIALSALTMRQCTIWRDTLSLFSHIVKLYPDSAVANAGKATALAEAGRLTESMALFDKAIRREPSLSVAHYGRGLALLRLGKPIAASESFELALRWKPNDTEAWLNLGAARYQAAQFERAVEAFEQVLARDDRRPDALYNLGLARAALGSMDQAIGLWRRAVAEASATPGFLETLAWHLATDPDESLRAGAEAVELAERACRLTDGTSPASLDALAAAYAETGQFDRAVETAEQAVAAARRLGMTPFADAIRDRLALYRAGQPYRSRSPARR